MENPLENQRLHLQQAMDAILKCTAARDEYLESRRSLSVLDPQKFKRDYNICYQLMLETFRLANQVMSDPPCKASFRVLKRMAKTFVMLHEH